MIGPQPYLIDPKDYFKLICCLVEKRYEPAKDELSQAVIDLAAIDGRIATYEATFKEGWQLTFEKTAKGLIPSVIDCCDYDRDNNAQTSS